MDDESIIRVGLSLHSDQDSVGFWIETEHKVIYMYELTEVTSCFPYEYSHRKLKNGVLECFFHNLINIYRDRNKAINHQSA